MEATTTTREQKLEIIGRLALVAHQLDDERAYTNDEAAAALAEVEDQLSHACERYLREEGGA